MRAPIIASSSSGTPQATYSLKGLTEMAGDCGLTHPTGQAGALRSPRSTGSCEIRSTTASSLAGAASQGAPQAGHFSMTSSSRCRRCSQAGQPSPPHEATACLHGLGDLRAMRLRLDGRDQEGPIRLLPLHGHRGACGNTYSSRRGAVRRSATSSSGSRSRPNVAGGIATAFGKARRQGDSSSGPPCCSLQQQQMLVCAPNSIVCTTTVSATRLPRNSGAQKSGEWEAELRQVRTRDGASRGRQPRLRDGGTPRF